MPLTVIYNLVAVAVAVAVAAAALAVALATVTTISGDCGSESTWSFITYLALSWIFLVVAVVF